MLKKITSILKNNSRGATAIEYALIASLIAVVAIGGARLIGNSVGNKLNFISQQINNT